MLKVWRIAHNQPSIKGGVNYKRMHFLLPRVCHFDDSTAENCDHHNCQHQDDLELEHVVCTVNWHKHVNLTIFSMVLVDAMNRHKNLIYDEYYHDESSHDWLTNFAM